VLVHAMKTGGERRRRWSSILMTRPSNATIARWEE
jgi:hypothetical protein